MKNLTNHWSVFLLLLFIVVGYVLSLCNINIAFYPPASNHTALWQLFTYGFTHGNLLHLALNMVFLYQLGKYTATYYSNWFVLVVFVVSVFFGGCAYGLTADGVLPLVGSSAATYGFIAIGILLNPWGRTRFAVLITVPNMLLPVLCILLEFAMCLYFGVQIGIAAHIGGLAAGAILFFAHEFIRLNSNPYST